MYAVEKNIQQSRPRVQKQYPFAKMEEGDSFFIPFGDGDNKASVRNRVYMAARYAGIRISTQGSDDGIRVWFKEKK